MAVDGRRHRAFVLAEEVLVNTHTGTIVRSLPPVDGSLRLAVDPHSGHMFVAADVARAAGAARSPPHLSTEPGDGSGPRCQPVAAVDGS